MPTAALTPPGAGPSASTNRVPTSPPASSRRRPTRRLHWATLLLVVAGLLATVLPTSPNVRLAGNGWRILESTSPEPMRPRGGSAWMAPVPAGPRAPVPAGPRPPAPVAPVPAGLAPADEPSTVEAVPEAAPSGAGGSGLVAAMTSESGRPFAADSAWNTRIPKNPVLDPNSAAMVASVTPRGRAYANLYEFGDPVFTADASTPTATVECTKNWGPCDLEAGPLRIPLEARPTTGSDGRVIVVDLVNRTSCDFWQAVRLSATRWTASWGTCGSLDGDGRGGATGAGVNALTGVVRTHEMRNLDIPHALSVATNNSCAGEFRYPASKTDGRSSRPDCVPEGARLQLDPSIDVDAIPGITPGEKAVARALQTYGAINRDNSGSPLCISFETPIGEADPYPAVGFPWDYYDMPHIPWDRLRVLRSWDGA